MSWRADTKQRFEQGVMEMPPTWNEVQDLRDLGIDYTVGWTLKDFLAFRMLAEDSIWGSADAQAAEKDALSYEWAMFLARFS